MSFKKVSIIVPVFNGEKYINECLESLLAQKYENIEIIIVNDGSTDRTDGIIKEKYISNDKIKYILKKNEGVAVARNRGIESADGEYITFVDGDDWIGAEFLENAVFYSEKFDADIVHGGTVFSYDNHDEDHLPLKSKNEWIIEEQISKYKQSVMGNIECPEIGLLNCFTSGSVCKLFKRKLFFNNIRFNRELLIGEDTVFIMEVLENVKSIVLVPQKWYYYRMNQYSATKSFRPEIASETKKMLFELKKYANNVELNLAFQERAVQQFYEILLLYPLHSKCPISFNEKLIYIEYLLNDDFWMNIFTNINLKKIPASRIGKILVYLCKKKKPLGVFCLVKTKNAMKKIRMRLK